MKMALFGIILATLLATVEQKMEVLRGMLLIIYNTMNYCPEEDLNLHTIAGTRP